MWTPIERVMQGPTRACLWLVVVVGCGGGAASEGARDAQGQRASAQALAALESRFEEQGERLQELESRMSLLETEARQIRDSLSRGRQRPNQVVRIGGSEEQSSQARAHHRSSRSNRGEGSEERPVLRLKGKPARPRRGSSEPFVPPQPPSGVPDRLPVTVSAEAASRAELSRDSGDGAPDAEDAAVGEYRKALRLMHRGEFDAALEALAAFVVRNPDHRLAEDATYWRGEAYYAKRDYEQALKQFEGVVASAPDSEKAPRALYKIALCHRRLGREAEAKRALKRLHRRFPNSDAAAAATREDAS